jgi:hypothetical protein
MLLVSANPGKAVFQGQKGKRWEKYQGSCRQQSSGQVFAEMLAAVCHPEFFEYSEQEAYVIYIHHTSFQLYHCRFPQAYITEAYDNGEVQNSTVTLNKTQRYDFCYIEDRGKCLEVFVALIRYLISGESKVCFLNKSHRKNLLHKVILDNFQG